MLCLDRNASNIERRLIAAGMLISFRSVEKKDFLQSEKD
jgi:hypothetical protein